jgi:hypothetical protein
VEVDVEVLVLVVDEGTVDVVVVLVEALVVIVVEDNALVVVDIVLVVLVVDTVFLNAGTHSSATAFAIRTDGPKSVVFVETVCRASFGCPSARVAR